MEKLSQVVYYLKTYYPSFSFECNGYEALCELMTHDKKNEGGIINFTLLSNVGVVKINQSVTKEKVLESFDFYRESFGVYQINATFAPVKNIRGVAQPG